MYFAVLRDPGPSWVTDTPLRRQPDWEAHARFMDGLAEDRFIHLGGPLGDDGTVLLIVEAGAPTEVHARLGRDPWAVQGVLRTAAVHPWQILLGADAPADVGPSRAERFAVFFEQGARWAQGVSMRQQAMWAEHASFMNSLADAGVVVIGGPLSSADGVHRALLVVETPSATHVEAQLRADPWAGAGLLRIAAVRPWRILLGNAAA